MLISTFCGVSAHRASGYRSTVRCTTTFKEKMWVQPLEKVEEKIRKWSIIYLRHKIVSNERFLIFDG